MKEGGLFWVCFFFSVFFDFALREGRCGVIYREEEILLSQIITIFYDEKRYTKYHVPELWYFYFYR